MKDLSDENGDFMFHTRNERCEHMEYIKNRVEMNNIRICNTGNVALSVNGCFNVFMEKLCAIILRGRDKSCLRLQEA